MHLGYSYRSFKMPGKGTVYWIRNPFKTYNLQEFQKLTGKDVVINYRICKFIGIITDGLNPPLIPGEPIAVLVEEKECMKLPLES